MRDLHHSIFHRKTFRQLRCNKHYIVVMSSPWIFISPSSRGIGYALTQHLLQTTRLPILASTRNPQLSDAKRSFLSSLPLDAGRDASDRLHMVHIDVTNESTIANAAKHADKLFPSTKHHLHLACTLPGILLVPEKSPQQIDYTNAMKTFETNTIGPLLLMKHFSPFLPTKATTLPTAEVLSHLPQTALWLSMAARVGSVTDNRSGGWYSYRASKTAVMSLVKGFDIWINSRSGEAAMAVGYHPGTVRTEFTKDYWNNVPKGKLFHVDDAVEKMVKVMGAMKTDMRGRTWDWKGEEVPP